MSQQLGQLEVSESASQTRWPIPPEWRWARVCDVGTVKLGKQLTSSKRPKAKLTPYIRTANITSSGLNLSEVLKMDLTESEREALKLMRGDILLADSSGSAAHVGRSAIWNDEIPGCCYQNHIIRFRPYSLAPEYAQIVFQYLRASGTFAKTSHGLGILHLGAARFAQLEIPVPSEAEQRSIVEEANRRLEHLAEANSAMESALLGLDHQLSALLESAATGQLSGSSASEGVVKNISGSAPLEMWSIPSTWEWSRVSDVGETILGRQRAPKHEQGENLTSYLRVANVFEDLIDSSDLLSMNFTPEEQEKYRLQNGDILLNEGQSAELVGRPALYRGHPPAVCFQNTLVRFRPSPLLNPEFALIVFRAYLRCGIFRTIAKWSTNIAHLGLKRFDQLPFPLPPLEVQSWLVGLVKERISQIASQRATILASLTRTEEMRAAVLSAAVGGSLSTRPRPGEESAEAMLSRLGPPPKEVRPTRSVETSTETEQGESTHVSLTKTLRELVGGATAEDLFASAGYDRDLTREVENFYLDLRGSLGKTIRCVHSQNSELRLEVIPDET